MSPAPTGRGYKRLVHNWDSDRSSLCSQKVAKDPSFQHADIEDFDQTGRRPRLILVLAGHMLLVLSCTGRYPTLSNYQYQQTRSVHDEYSWYSSRQTSISIQPAFLRNKSIAYLKKSIEQTAVIQFARASCCSCRKLRLQ